METKKINLKEFKKESLLIKKLLEAKGGSGSCNSNGRIKTNGPCCDFANPSACGDNDW